MKIILPVTWEVYGEITVKADSIEDAVKKFNSNSDSFPLPNNSEYVDGSFRLTDEDAENIKLYQTII
jgi:hypothetical protein